MYDSKQVSKEISVPLTLEFILSKISEYQIYAHFLGEFKIGEILKSPFRKDKNPSFGIFKSRKSGKLLWKDHGNGDCGDIIDFVRNYTGLSNFNDVLCHIKSSIIDHGTTTIHKGKEEEEVSIDKPTVIGVVRQAWTDIDDKYWSTFHISRSTLNKFKVSSIKYYLCNGIVKGVYKDNNPMYAYKVYNQFKIYRPLGDKFTKWRNNLTERDIQGYEQLPKTGELLIITKSLKDVMCLYEMGYNAISPSSESTFIPEDILNKLRERFKTILICFDRDPSGVKNMRKYSLKTGLKCILVHKKFKAKDISDAIKLNGLEIVKNWLKTTL